MREIRYLRAETRSACYPPHIPPWIRLINRDLFVMVANIVMTIPFGIYLRYYFRCSWKKTLFLSLGLSLIFELTQPSALFGIYPRPYRLCETDDLITNTLGGMILDIVHTSQSQPFVQMSPDISDASDELRAFLFERVYNDDWRALEEKRCDYVLTALFEHFSANPTEMPDEYVQLIYQDGVERAVCDFLAGM